MRLIKIHSLIAGTGIKGELSRETALRLSARVFKCALRTMGVPVRDAGILGNGLAGAGLKLLDFFADSTVEEALPKLEQYPWPWVIIHLRPKDWKPLRPSIFSAKFVVSQPDKDTTIPELREWARDLGLGYFSILDFSSITATALLELKCQAVRR